ncbi:hypothetical protein [Methylocystis heyeri]|uniref:Uncharacterized protein n=1 Tax=Methylocystis heyeri TaxID=391905 RepID=A0A6B8KA69_9HYPH|nr:hypothetical protein [Methylocystis heyeri]QGM44332.1 hypothetical protein H2LOC_000680 [Methylocystis heyeri]
MSKGAEGQDQRRDQSLSLQIPGAAALLVAVAALCALVAFGFYDLKAAAGGWLMAAVFWSGVAVGCLFAVMIHTLTGGRWGAQFAAALVPGSIAAPLVVALFAPVLAALRLFYPWAQDPAAAPADVSQLYLNAPFYIARTLAALAFWSLIGVLLTRLAGTALLLSAAIGLAIHGLIIGLIGLDWILSLEPVFISTSFGATLAFTQLAAALAFAAIVAPESRDGVAVGDIGGLLLATLLGVVYLNFIAVLVIWYGDLPHKVLWLVRRDHWPWTLIAGLAFFLGAVFPIFWLFLQRVRNSRRGLRIIGAIALAGIALYYAYLIGPPFGALSLGAGLVAMIGIGALFVAFIGAPWARTAFCKWSSGRAP